MWLKFVVGFKFLLVVNRDSSDNSSWSRWLVKVGLDISRQLNILCYVVSGGCYFFCKTWTKGGTIFHPNKMHYFVFGDWSNGFSGS